VIRALPTVVRHLHYHTEAGALAVVADSSHSPVHGKGTLRDAVGLAVPALEARLRGGLDPHGNETAWIQGYRVGKLKAAV
jgi:hypothetical protein